MEGLRFRKVAAGRYAGPMRLALPTGYVEDGPALTADGHVTLARGPSGPCVVKRLPARLLREPEAMRDLDREARVLGALAGRGAPALLGRGADGHGPFLVTTRAEGALLADVIDPARLAPAARAAFAALADVHGAADAGGPLLVVHGDPSPRNVVVAPDENRAVCIDFGLAGFRDAPLAPSPSLRGTLVVVAPEVARGEAATQASDVYALALSVLGVLAGRPLREAPSAAAMLVLAESGELALPEAPDAAWRALLPALERCVARDPAARPAAAAIAGRG